jgi:hypothetical protein
MGFHIMYVWFYILFSFLSIFFICNKYTLLLMAFFVIINGYMTIMGCYLVN